MWAGHVEAFFDKLEAGLQMMKASNDHFVITRDDDKMFIDVGENGTFILIVRSDDQEISVQSPVNGGHAYTFDAERDWWVDVNDDHNLLELLSRDLMYVAKGYPTF